MSGSGLPWPRATRGHGQRIDHRGHAWWGTTMVIGLKIAGLIDIPGPLPSRLMAATPGSCSSTTSRRSEGAGNQSQGPRLPDRFRPVRRGGAAEGGRQRPDAVILDLGLPVMDGIDVIRGLADGPTSRSSCFRCVMPSGRRSCPRCRGGRLCHQAFRDGRAPGPAPGCLATGGSGRWMPRRDHPRFQIDLSAKRVPGADDDEMRLTPTEWGIVEVLVRNQGKLVSQTQLLNEVWGPQYGEETNYLRVFMAQLRRKLEPQPGTPALLHHRARDGISIRATRARKESCLSSAATG